MMTYGHKQRRGISALRQRRVRLAQPSLHSAGFTIVEMMVATLVFTVILIVVTTGVIRFTNDYYKGVNSSSTQATVQNAMDLMTQAIQYSNTGTTATASVSAGSNGFFCAGSKAFVYTAGKQYDGSAGNWGLYTYDYSGGCPMAAPGGSVANGQQLLSKNMRLAYIKVSSSGAGSWAVSMEVAYGDDDLLCQSGQAPNSSGGCAETAAAATSLFGNDVQCKVTAGSHFCAVSRLDGVVSPRF